MDRFQGQEAPVVVVSLCLSADCATNASLEFAPDIKRLNVAVTRAQFMCIILCHPELMALPLSNRSAKTDIEHAQRVKFLRALGADKGNAMPSDASEYNRLTQPSKQQHRDRE